MGTELGVVGLDGGIAHLGRQLLVSRLDRLQFLEHSESLVPYPLVSRLKREAGTPPRRPPRASPSAARIPRSRRRRCCGRSRSSPGTPPSAPATRPSRSPRPALDATAPKRRRAPA